MRAVREGRIQCWQLENPNGQLRRLEEDSSPEQAARYVGPEKLGITGRDAEAYSDAIAMGTLDPGHSDVFSKIRKDFDAAGVAQSDEQILRVIERTHAPSRASDARQRKEVPLMDWR